MRAHRGPKISRSRTGSPVPRASLPGDIGMVSTCIPEPTMPSPLALEFMDKGLLAVATQVLQATPLEVVYIHTCPLVGRVLLRPFRRNRVRSE
eukprot:15478196-Alexandrium_andersonii.AAC.2